MGRSLLIICSGVLITMGIVGINTSRHGNMLTQKTVNYAEFTMAKNTAHTAIQLAMQEINKDESFMTTHTAGNPWTGAIDGRSFELYVEALNDVSGNAYWDADSLRVVSKATQNVSQVSSGAQTVSAEVVTIYLKDRFSSFVPVFGAALQFPTGFGSLTADGNAHMIDGTADHCPSNKPAIVTNADATAGQIKNNSDLNYEGEIAVDPKLSYEPVDELIERLWNSGNATTVTSDYSDALGTADDPGVFFLEDNVRLTGQQSEGYGIMVIRDTAYMEYDSSGTSVDIRGNFEFNGLVIFENAELFDGRGTPTINGSVLVGHTSDNPDPIDINLGGNIEINYDCDGEDYARQSAADAIQQNKYTNVVTTINTNYLDN